MLFRSGQLILACLFNLPLCSVIISCKSIQHLRSVANLIYVVVLLTAFDILSLWFHHRSKAPHTLSTNYHPSHSEWKAEKLAIISCPDLNSTGPYLQVIRCPACQFKVWPHEIIHISYCSCTGYIKYINYQLDIAISSSVIIRKIYFTVILCIYIIVIYFYCTKWLFTNLFLFHFQTKDCDMHAYAHLY